MKTITPMDFIDYILEREQYKGKLFLSIGFHNTKAIVKCWEFNHQIKEKIKSSIYKIKKKTGKDPNWIKIDLVTEQYWKKFEEVLEEMIATRRNYIDFGVAFDKYWDLSFIPEEINSNAFVKPSKYDKSQLILSEENINHYLKKYKQKKAPFKISQYINKDVIVFRTKGYFYDYNDIYELETKGPRKNLRKNRDIHEEIEKMITTSTEYLSNEIEPNGKYKYGYFPHFDREIKFYNILRHCSSTYSLIEGLHYLNKDLSIVEKPLDYIIKNAIIYNDSEAYVYDEHVNEVKLGQNAAFIFAICEYLKYSSDNKDYLKIAQSVANGILSMINQNTMDTIHVLNYPDLSIKENFRIIYYDGEAALALLRLYQIDGQQKWLDVVKKMLDNFIEKEYWRHHDHWLSYCTNELVSIVPEKKYFEFGLRNTGSYLEFIFKRETAFPTFLEMLMSTYQLVKKARQNEFDYLIKQNIDMDKLEQTLHYRADFQRAGYFYPETAMYFKNPQRVLGAFFIKHHGYRTRIDDIEHYLSGYVNYQLEFSKKLDE